MRDAASRMFLFIIALLGVWVVTFWLYEPTGSRRVRVTSDASLSAVSAPVRVTVDPPEARPADIQTPPDRQAPPAIDPPPTRMVNKVKPPAFRDYVVQRGDTGWMQIAERPEVYGDARKWQVVARANPFATPDRLRPGKTILRIPVDPDVDGIQGTLVQVPESGAAPPTETPTGGGAPAQADASPKERTYTIGPSDSLWSIAKKQYGKGSLWKLIYEANREVIKDPDRPKAGVVLRIPPAPESSR